MNQDSSFEDILHKNFKLENFRPGQKEIITSALAKKDVLAVLPTGGGKSLCYQFPAIYSQGLVVVISPLIALMKDQVLGLQRNQIPAGCLHSGQTEEEKLQVFKDIQKGGPYVLYLSPERVQKEGFQKWILDRKITLFAVDEAHCVSQWGHDFREEYTQLRILKQLRPDVPILALTASATPTVLLDISKNLTLKDPDQRVHGFYRPNLYYQVESCESEDAKDLMLFEAIKQNPEGRVLVYCGTRKVTEYVAEFLKLNFKKVAHYHAGLSTEERTRTQNAYIKSELRILVATNAFGMGIDQPDVRLVVHYQMPGNIDALYQEMGRAGRDEKHSTCLMLYSKKDKGLQSFFIQNSKAPKNIKEARWKNLEALISYSESNECRHAEILAYYKDPQKVPLCGHCDSCDPQSERRIKKQIRPIERTSSKSTSKTKSKSKTKIKPSVGSPTGDSLILTAEQEERFQRLRAWRKKKALELDTAAFIIFSDRALKHMAIDNPKNLDQLLNVFGVGESKVEKFGWDILAELG